MELPQLAKLAFQGGASLVLVAFAYRVFKYLKQMVDNHLDHIEEHTENAAETSQQAVKQNKDLIEVNEEMHGTLKEILKEQKTEQ